MLDVAPYGFQTGFQHLAVRSGLDCPSSQLLASARSPDSLAEITKIKHNMHNTNLSPVNAPALRPRKTQRTEQRSNLTLQQLHGRSPAGSTGFWPRCSPQLSKRNIDAECFSLGSGSSCEKPHTAQPHRPDAGRDKTSRRSLDGVWQ